MKAFLPPISRQLCYGILLFYLGLSWGCVTPGSSPQEKDLFNDWKARVETSRPIHHIPPRKQVTPSTATTKTTPAETRPAAQDQGDTTEPVLPTQKISVRFVDDDIANVLRALARMADQNILINPSVSGVVNAHIVAMPWNTVFTGLIKSYGLILKKDGDLLRVMTTDDLKKQVERQAVEREGQLIASLQTGIFPIQYADPDGILQSVTPLLSKDKEGKPRGSVSVDKHSRSLIVNDVAANMERINALINDLDRPTPQILIEAHIVETTQDTARELGVQWGGGAIKNTGRDTVTTSAAGINSTSAGPLGATSKSLSGNGFVVDMPAQALGNFQPAGISFQLLNNSTGNFLDLQLSALQKAGKADILSQPSIVTLDNNEAVIESGRDIPFQTIEDGSVKIEYKEASLKLTVTPHVIADHLVKLDIAAKKDEVDFSNSVAGNPMIIKKQAHTQLIVDDGATVVIAGLSKDKRSSTKTGVPAAKDVPLLGWLFKNDAKSSDFEEILIFISPKILQGQQTAQLPGKPVP